MVALQRPSSKSVTKVVPRGRIDASYGIPHGMGVNPFFSATAPRAEKMQGMLTSQAAANQRKLL